MFGRKAARIADLEFALRKANLLISKLQSDLDAEIAEHDYNLRLLKECHATIHRLTNEILEPKIVNADLKARP